MQVKKSRLFLEISKYKTFNIISISMKLRGGIFYLIVLLVAGLMITPVLGSTNQAANLIKPQIKNTDTITVEFVDFTGPMPVKKEVTILKTEWMTITSELHKITKSGMSLKGIITAQCNLLQKHSLLSADTNIDSLFSTYNKRTNNNKREILRNRFHPAPLNNTLFSVLSAISYTLENGTTIVLGLNSFINLIGFNIVSFHKGYALEGIETNGMMSTSVPPGEYAGFMFGFFGYWFGTKTSTGVYSNVTVAGLTFITLWAPIQSP